MSSPRLSTILSLFLLGSCASTTPPRLELSCSRYPLPPDSLMTPPTPLRPVHSQPPSSPTTGRVLRPPDG